MHGTTYVFLYQWSLCSFFVLSKQEIVLQSVLTRKELDGRVPLVGNPDSYLDYRRVSIQSKAVCLNRVDGKETRTGRGNRSRRGG